MTEQARHRRNMGGMVFGLTIMLLGTALFLDRTGVIDGFDLAMFWPLALITIGLAKLSRRRDDGSRQGGWWVLFGVVLLLNQVHLLHLHDAWPLLVVAFGVSIVWKEMRTRARVE